MKPFEVYGNRGLKSKPFRKAFKTVDQRERWLTKHAEDITVLGYSEPIIPTVSQIQWPVETRDGSVPYYSSRQANHRSPFGMGS